jgi:hypothetical protein
MMTCRKHNAITITLLLTAAFFFNSCTDSRVQFIVTSDEDGIICSAKSSFNDTIFYENKFQDTTLYYYVKLSKQENQELKKMILNIKENRISKFEMKPGSAVFIVQNGDVKFYEGNYSIQSPNIKKIFTLFNNKGVIMKEWKKVEDFWNIDGVIPPDNPIP